MKKYIKPYRYDKNFVQENMMGPNAPQMLENPHAKGDAPLPDADTGGYLTLIYMTGIKK